MFEEIKFTGSGLGYRKQLFQDFFGLKDIVDSVEVISEHFLKESYLNEENLEQIINTYNIILHGLNLSIASPIIDMVYLMNIKKLVLKTKVPYYTDHLSITRNAGYSYGHLSPILYNNLSLQTCIDNVNQVQDILGVPLALENITYGFNMAENGYSHGDFFSKLVDKTGCGILLDVTNAFINSYNHNIDGKKYLDSLPLKNVIHIHISGGNLNNKGQYIDSHSYKVPEEVWTLLDYVLPKTSVKNVILERDGQYDMPLDAILQDVTKCKSLLKKHQKY